MLNHKKCALQWFFQYFFDIQGTLEDTIGTVWVMFAVLNLFPMSRRAMPMERKENEEKKEDEDENETLLARLRRLVIEGKWTWSSKWPFFCIHSVFNGDNVFRCISISRCVRRWVGRLDGRSFGNGKSLLMEGIADDCLSLWRLLCLFWSKKRNQFFCQNFRYDCTYHHSVA